ncbi:MAG: DUF2254 domain-containing protein [Acidimicrobiales bacterium]
MRGRTLLERLRSSLWFLPALFVTAAIAQGLLLPVLEERTGDRGVSTFFFEGGPEGARVVLSMIAGSTLTLTVLVFSITIVALQLASSQFSPRVLRTFLRDWYSQAALGVFAATFAYAMTVLRAVKSDEPGVEAFVPRLSVSMAFVWVMISLAVFVLYVNHTARGLRVVSVIGKVGDETRHMIERELPLVPGRQPTGELPADGGRLVSWAGKGGVLRSVDVERLVRLADRSDVVLEVVPMVGDFVPHGSPVFAVHGPGGPADAELAATADLGLERNMVQDLRFGFRQLVDIAERALSPAVNDPTTAVQAIDQMHDLLRLLATRPWPTGRFGGADGTLRVVVHEPSWDELVHLAVDEIRVVGAAAIQVDGRLRTMLEDLRTVVPPDRRSSVEAELALLEAGVRRDVADAADRERVFTVDPPD